jgi:hypothetical protein
MARLKSPIARKLRKALTERFPPPATVKLDDEKGISGVITSWEFKGIDPLDRQKVFSDLLAAKLTREERREIQILVGVTPEEETFYLAGVD